MFSICMEIFSNYLGCGKKKINKSKPQNIGYGLKPNYVLLTSICSFLDLKASTYHKCRDFKVVRVTVALLKFH